MFAGTLQAVPKGEYLQYGGQAIIEGVMMRSAKFFSVACRAPNGKIVYTTEAIEKTWIGRQQWLKLPFLRGALAILDGMALGIKSMRFASNVQMEPQYQTEEELAKIASGEVKAAPSKKVQDLSVLGAMIFAVVFGLVIFQGIPNFISVWLAPRLGWNQDWMINLTTEIVKIIMFLGYIALIAQMPEIKRVFQYHGAEHKAINVLEANEELVMDNCRKMTRLHPRCGTSFAIVVLIVSLVIFTFIPRPPIEPKALQALVRFLIEIPAVFVISGISYEAIRLAGRFRNTLWVNALFFPGLMTQYLTTREPDEDQIEVALVALKQCLDAEDGQPVPEGIQEAIPA